MLSLHNRYVLCKNIQILHQSSIPVTYSKMYTQIYYTHPLSIKLSEFIHLYTSQQIQTGISCVDISDKNQKPNTICGAFELPRKSIL